MRISSHLSLADPAAPRDNAPARGAQLAEADHPHLAEADHPHLAEADHPHLAEADHPHLADADRLISDLEALVDAGLLVVHEHVLGPARYGVAPEPDRVA